VAAKRTVPAMEALIQRLVEANPGVPEEAIWRYVQRQLQAESREYATSFRSPLNQADAPPPEVRLTSRCHCGRSVFCWDVEVKSLKLSRCYCPSCCRFLASSFAAYLSSDVALPLPNKTGGSIQTARGVCKVLGTVDRFLCSACFSKIAVAPVHGDQAGKLFICLGSVEDDSIPNGLAMRWQTGYDEWERVSEPSWWRATPGPCVLPHRSLQLRGACSCGKCEFSARLLPGEAQHCYCKLCRRMSGSVAQTWLPAPKESFSWTRSEGLRLFRTTSHGQRHVCTSCGTIMTIVYDSQPDCIWPAGGTLDMDSLTQGLANGSEPKPPPILWYRVIHICCSYMQSWYQLPDDELPRLKYAG